MYKMEDSAEKMQLNFHLVNTLIWGSRQLGKVSVVFKYRRARICDKEQEVKENKPEAETWMRTSRRKKLPQSIAKARKVFSQPSHTCRYELLFLAALKLQSFAILFAIN
ncbi:hypothetical protein TcasGA2_TC001869 [Tribolium castaneum]|uniref:Uncharacterized protein n=1 Tax=Tribolium castaneum TaxID=7070 RepID=D7EJP5_TRICA|nr:hypothetical protein TcasGA2_TC001869 [Tribolium castaneum]